MHNDDSGQSMPFILYSLPNTILNINDMNNNIWQIIKHNNIMCKGKLRDNKQEGQDGPKSITWIIVN